MKRKKEIQIISRYCADCGKKWRKGMEGWGSMTFSFTRKVQPYYALSVFFCPGHKRKP